MIARRKGYRIALVMPDNVTAERRQVAALFGAEIIDSPGAEGSNGAIRLARSMAAADPRYVMPDQYANPANPRAHYETTGPEILAACPEVDVFVAGLGTGGTLMGVGRYLREHKPGVRIVAAEPLPGENVQGLRSLEEGFVPEILDPGAARREVPRLEPRRHRRAARPRDQGRRVRAARRAGPCWSPRPARRARLERGTIVARAPRRRLEVPLRGHVRARPGRDGGRPRGRGALVVAHPAPAVRCGSPRRMRGGHRGAGPRRVPARGVRAHRRDPGTPPWAAALRYIACRNAAASPVRYAVHPDDLYRITVETDDADEVIWGIVHSHVRSPAVPSPTDIGLALYPDALYLLVSLAERAPALRAWRIVDGAIHEVEVEVA